MGILKKWGDDGYIILLQAISKYNYSCKYQGFIFSFSTRVLKRKTSSGGNVFTSLRPTSNDVS